MLLGLASATAADAAKAAKSYGEFINHEAPKAGRLIDRLSGLIAEADTAKEIDEIRLCRTRPWAMIVGADGAEKSTAPKAKNTRGHLTT